MTFNKLSRNTIGALALISASVFASGAIAQQQPAPAAGQPAAGQQQQIRVANSGWTKLCSKIKDSEKSICQILQRITTESGQFIASAAINEVKEDNKRNLIVSVPPGMLIKPGLAVQIDKNTQRKLEFSICFPNACFAELAVDDSIIAEMKAGNNVVISTRGQRGNQIGFPLSLAGFTKSYDGDPVDPAVMKQQEEQLRQELQRKAEEARQRLIQEQQKATQPSN